MRIVAWTLTAICLPASAASLDELFAEVSATHPEIAAIEFQERAATASRTRAEQKPGLHLHVDADNLLSSQGAFDATELTVSLASVLERGGKSAARVAVANSQVDALALTREAKRVDLYAELARRFIDALDAAARVDLIKAQIIEKEATVAAARRRVDAGASPTSVLHAARAALARAYVDLKSAEIDHQTALSRLSALLPEGHAVDVVEGDLMGVLDAPPLPDLAAAVASAPELRTFADARRLREAKLRLAETERDADLEWSAGLRRSEERDDFSLVASIDLPLGASGRAQPGIDEARAELDAWDKEQAGRMQTLRATLAEAAGQFEKFRSIARDLQAEVLPEMIAAERSAREAYKQGAASYLEWAQQQDQTREVRMEIVSAAVAANRAVIEIERLLGTSIRSLR